MALACGLATSAGARDLFILESTGGGIVPSTQRGSGHDLEQLLEDYLLRRAPFVGVGGPATLDYLGIANAARITPNLAGTQVTVEIPSIGFSRSFTGTSRSDVEHQIERFFEGDGAHALAKFYEKTTSHTPLALLDGNPRSTTALFARGAFDRFGLGALRTREGYGRTEDVLGHFDLYARAGGGAIDADPFEDLWVADGSLSLGGDVASRVGLYLTGIGQYRSFNGADIYDAGLELALPIVILAPSDARPVRWAITPVVQSGGGGSQDLLSGGFMVGGGGVSALGLNLGPLELTIADELVYYGGVDLGEIENISFDTRLDQWITRNGAKLAFFPLGNQALWLEAGASVTNFLGTRAAVDWYASPFAGVGVKLFDVLRLRLGWESDFGESDYAAHTGRAELGFEF
jgi:hypothetical protein